MTWGPFWDHFWAHAPLTPIPFLGGLNTKSVFGHEMASQTTVWADNLSILHSFCEESVSGTPGAWFRPTISEIAKQNFSYPQNGLPVDELGRESQNAHLRKKTRLSRALLGPSSGRKLIKMVILFLGQSKTEGRP